MNLNLASLFNLKGLLVALGVGLVAGSVLSGVVVHKVDQASYAALQSRYDKRELAWGQAVQKAKDDAARTQKAQDDATLAHAITEAQAQERIVTRTQTIIQKVDHYVTDRSTCITYGLIRVLDAAATGRDPESLQLPAGQSDDACAPVDAPTLARSVVANYGVARQNAEQLDGLIAYERERQHIDAAVGGK